jgi:hypothetical protein
VCVCVTRSPDKKKKKSHSAKVESSFSKEKDILVSVSGFEGLQYEVVGCAQQSGGRFGQIRDCLDIPKGISGWVCVCTGEEVM